MTNVKGLAQYHLPALAVVVSLLGVALVFSWSAASAVSAGALWGDCSEYLYVANEGNGGGGTDITKVDCNGTISNFATGLGGPAGLAPDGDYMWVSDDLTGVFRFDATGSSIALSASFNNANSIAVDLSGQVLVSDANAGELRRLTVDSSGTITNDELLADFSTHSSLEGVAVNSAGDVLFSSSVGTVYIIDSSASSFPVTPSTATDIGVGVVVSDNIGHMALDSSDNIYIGDFGGRIVRIDAGGATAKDVVDIANPGTCDTSQTGVLGDLPAFRGFAVSPDGDLFVTGYCLDNVYMFSQSDLQNAWDTNTPIAALPAPVLENPSGALDGPDFNGPFGLAFWSGSVGAPVYACQGTPATIVGTNGNDVIFGTVGDDVIVGLQGNDIIYGEGGNDRICGGAGRDEIYGEEGDDTIFGGPGADLLHGGLGHDKLRGYRGNDVIWGDEGNDDIRGNRGNDVIFGGPGDDDLRGNKHGDTLFGGDGNDALYGRLGDDYLYGQGEADELFGGQGDDVERGGDGDDAIRCGAGADYADGGPGFDSSVPNCETQVDIP